MIKNKFHIAQVGRLFSAYRAACAFAVLLISKR